MQTAEAGPGGHRPLRGAALRDALLKKLEDMNARMTTEGEWRWIRVPVERYDEAVATFQARGGDGPYAKR